jgi:peptidyl-prolyl cis-trans isomerase A (cyclophilin A)
VRWLIQIIWQLVLAASPVSAAGDIPRPVVVLQTTRGSISIELETAAAPVTACNFLRYAREGRYNNGSFYRTVRHDQGFGNPVPIDVIQADGPVRNAGGDRPPIPLERTRDTRLSHLAGTISMARDGPDTATTSFFLVVRDSTELDFGGRRNPDGQGFAGFGHVISGMDVVDRIFSEPSDQEKITKPVTILGTRTVPEASVCGP